MAADWDGSGYDGSADTVKISETHTGTADFDAYEADPDAENYAAGNDPVTAYRNQGRPDGPNGLDSYVNEGGNQETQLAQGADAESDGANAETQETNSAVQTLDQWGDTDPDAENYAELDDIGTTADASRPDQDQLAERIDAEGTLSPELQRINALESENADAQKQIAETNQRIAELETENQDQVARLDRIEQLLANTEKNPVDTAEKGDGDKPAGSVDHQGAQVTAIAEHKDSDVGISNDDVQRHDWRRAASAERVGLASTALGATDTVAQFAMHATPEGVVGLGAMVLGVASLGLAKLEKKRKENKA